MRKRSQYEFDFVNLNENLAPRKVPARLIFKYNNKFHLWQLLLSAELLISLFYIALTILKRVAPKESDNRTVES
jgi:hypothetical protein